jgi:hypothetical protein
MISESNGGSTYAVQASGGGGGRGCSRSVMLAQIESVKSKSTKWLANAEALPSGAVQTGRDEEEANMQTQALKAV